MHGFVTVLRRLIGSSGVEASYLTAGQARAVVTQKKGEGPNAGPPGFLPLWRS